MVEIITKGSFHPLEVERNEYPQNPWPEQTWPEKVLLEQYAKCFDEKDPNGIAAKTPGAKLDAGKISVTRGCLHYFPRALTAVAELSGIGAKKYSWKGWEKVSDGINRYSDALGRHELAINGDFGKRDKDTGVLEATAVAWNALARLELILKEYDELAKRT